MTPIRQAAPVSEVHVEPLSLDRFSGVITATQARELERIETAGPKLLAGRTVWNVNSTARGGGVAEMLQSLIAYGRSAGVDVRWMVMGGEEDFFRVTKRLHNNLHGHAGDGGPLGDHERRIYEEVAAGTAEQLGKPMRPGDVALLHDPQTAGLVAPLIDRGALVIWRAHIGLDLPNERARDAWRFLIPYVRPALAYVFSRQAFVWEGLDADRIEIIQPSIDPFSAKNQDIPSENVRAILQTAGLRAGDRAEGRPEFMRFDGSIGTVARTAEMIEESRLPEGAPVVTQVSRWDRLKDPLGVMEGFIDHVCPTTDAHLVIAGPETAAVADDPEGADVVRSCIDRWHSLAPEIRPRVHLALLPMTDAEENAAMVNALQRGSTVVVQKSIAEGFGLTVAEAMWKSRPVVAGKVGGIQDQIVDGESGVLVDPGDLTAYGEAVRDLVLDPERAEQMGTRAHERVRDEFLGVRHLGRYLDLFERVIAANEDAA